MVKEPVSDAQLLNFKSYASSECALGLFAAVLLVVTHDKVTKGVLLIFWRELGVKGEG